MPTVNINGMIATYEECTENYEKALATNGQIDAVASELEGYVKDYDKIIEASSDLDSEGSLYGGIVASVAQISSVANGIEGSFSAMKAENLMEAKKIDDEITEQNRQNAIASLGTVSIVEK